METLDGFILNLFRTEKPILSQKDFENESVWVCDLLNQDTDLANEYIKFKLSTCKDRMEKLEFLYSSRSCFKYTVEGLENELNPETQSDFGYYRHLSKEEMLLRLNRYKNALKMTDQAICFYIDCSTLNCDDKLKKTLEFSNNQLTLIFYYFFTGLGLKIRTDIDITAMAKFIHVVSNKEYTKISNSDFYKRLRKAPNFVTDPELIKDLEIIKPIFEKVEMKNVVSLIDTEIAKARVEIKRKK